MKERSVTTVSTVIDNDPVVEFAAALRALVKSAQLTYKDIRDRLGIPISTLGGWLTGKSLVRQAALESIVELCGGDVRDWARRLEGVKDAEKRLPVPSERARRDLVSLVAQALGVQGELPGGAEVTLTVTLRLP